MAFELARFVNTAMRMENEDLWNLSTWVRNEQDAGTALLMKYIPRAQKLKIELPHHMKAEGSKAEGPLDPKNTGAKVQQAARDARSRGTHQSMAQLGKAKRVVDAQIQKIRTQSPPRSKRSTCIGWSAPLVPECIPHSVGTHHHNVNKLQRELGLTKLTVDKRNGSEYLRIEAPTQAGVSTR